MLRECQSSKYRKMVGTAMVADPRFERSQVMRMPDIVDAHHRRESDVAEPVALIGPPRHAFRLGLTCSPTDCGE